MYEVMSKINPPLLTRLHHCFKRTEQSKVVKYCSLCPLKPYYRLWSVVLVTDTIQICFGTSTIDHWR